MNSVSGVFGNPLSLSDISLIGIVFVDMWELVQLKWQ